MSGVVLPSKLTRGTLGIIIQARMTSKRFPGKTLAMLDGKTVLQRVVERCLMVPVAKIIVAMPHDTASQPIIDELETKFKNDRLFGYSGSEDDVLARFYDCAMVHSLDYVVRITADCPFIDPLVVGDVLSLLIKQNLDYTSNVYPDRTFPKGLDCEAFTMDCLEAAYNLAQTDYEKEHVTAWMQNEPEVKKGLVRNKRKITHEENYCVDYPEDIERLEKLLLTKLRPTGNIAQLGTKGLITKRKPTLVGLKDNIVKLPTKH